MTNLIIKTTIFLSAYINLKCTSIVVLLTFGVSVAQASSVNIASCTFLETVLQKHFGTTLFTVNDNKVIPPGANGFVSGTLTCITKSVTLIGSSPTPGVTYKWTGPDGFSSHLQFPLVSIPGMYTLTVTNPLNRGSSTATVNVIDKGVVPSAIAIVSGPLTPATTVVTLKASSPTAGVTYSWTGPNGFKSSSQVATTTVSGAYNLVVTDPTNGCTTATSVNVVRDITTPSVAAVTYEYLTVLIR
jgi:hypothetical protein